MTATARTRNIGPNVYVNVTLMSHPQLQSRFPATRDVRTALVEPAMDNPAVHDRGGNVAARRQDGGMVDEGSMPADSMRPA
jgi:hypothetical protein